MSKALFLDRDGIINQDHGYVFRQKDFHFVPGIIDIMKKYQTLGYMPIIVTNQSGIARGFFKQEDFSILMDWVVQELAKQGVHIKKIYHCPYHPDGIIAPYNQEHEDRKPSAGMFLKAISEFDIDPQASLMIGDSVRDMKAAYKADIGQRILINSKPFQNTISHDQKIYHTACFESVSDFLQSVLEKI